MLTMSHICKIRDLSNQGKSITEIIEETIVSYKTVRKYLDKEDFSEGILTKVYKPSILDPYKAEIEKIIDEKPHLYFNLNNIIKSIKLYI